MAVNETETLISVNSSGLPQRNPVVSGDLVAWADGLGQLHLYNLIDGNETVITNSTYRYGLPAISGNYLVAQAYNSGEDTYDIFLYQISSNISTILTPDTVNSDEIAPSISGTFISWKSFNYIDETCNVYLYDLNNPTNPAQLIAEDTNSCPCFGFVPYCLEPYSPPTVNGKRVVWDAVVDGFFDVFLYDINSGTTTNITSDTSYSDQEYPVVYGDEVAWQDNRNGNWNIYYANVSNISEILVSSVTNDFSSQIHPAIGDFGIVWKDDGNMSIDLYEMVSGSTFQITPELRLPNNPAMADNRIVYEGGAPPNIDIYLITYGVSINCPIANFTNSTPASAVSAPYTVGFTDTSSFSPAVTIWNFGDGTPVSRDANPAHIYSYPGVYNVSLVVNNPFCRNAIVKQNFVSIGQRPVVNFMGTPTCGIVPLSVSFYDESSGNPTEWEWDFNNNGVIESGLKNPTHLFTEGGNYSVNLTAKNVMGSSFLLKPGYISVMNKSNSIIDTNINGISIVNNKIVINTTLLPQYILDSNTLTLIPPLENGIEKVTLIGDDIGFTLTGNLVEGNITEAFITSRQILFNGMSERIGREVYANFTLELPTYPVKGKVEPYFIENMLPCDLGDFRTIVFGSGFSEITNSAYEFRLKTSNISSVINMTMNLSVNSSWVTDRSKIWVVRIGNDATGEVLPTHFVSEDTDHQLDVFFAYSPRGPSSFALMTLARTGNPLQIIVLIVQQLFGGASTSSDNDTCIPVCTWEKDGSTYASCNPADCPKGTASVSINTGTPLPSPTPAPAITTPPTIAGTLTLPKTTDGILNESFEVQAKDQKGTLSIFKGTRALNADGTPISEISIRPLDASEISSLPGGGSFQGIAYELLPDGATFDTPLVFTLVVPSETWNNSKRYSLQWYNRTSERWEAISTTSIPDSHTLIAHIEHFSVIGLFSYDLPVTTTTSEIPPSSPPVTTTPLSLYVGLLAVGIGVVWYIRGRR